jgi:hypothetical protein
MTRIHQRNSVGPMTVKAVPHATASLIPPLGRGRKMVSQPAE